MRSGDFFPLPEHERERTREKKMRKDIYKKLSDSCSDPGTLEKRIDEYIDALDLVVSAIKARAAYNASHITGSPDPRPLDRFCDKLKRYIHKHE